VQGILQEVVKEVQGLLATPRGLRGGASPFIKRRAAYTVW
jgi:hypothetical protein